MVQNVLFPVRGKKSRLPCQSCDVPYTQVHNVCVTGVRHALVPLAKFISIVSTRSRRTAHLAVLPPEAYKRSCDWPESLNAIWTLQGCRLRLQIEPYRSYKCYQTRNICIRPAGHVTSVDYTLYNVICVPTLWKPSDIIRDTSTPCIVIPK
jgi:hypothetical protein